MAFSDQRKGGRIAAEGETGSTAAQFHRGRQVRLRCDSGWTPESCLSETERATLASDLTSQQLRI